VLLSPRATWLNFHVNTFPLELEFANINALIPQTASTDYGRSGVSARVRADSYQFEIRSAAEHPGSLTTRFDK